MWEIFVLHWTILFTLIVANEKEAGSAFTARTITSSPTPNCQNINVPCLTWSECLANLSQCFSSHTNVTLLPGEYILHEYVAVFGVESLSLYGSTSEARVNSSARDNQVVVNCEYRGGGMGFIYVTDFVLSGITMVSCGVKGEDIGYTDQMFKSQHYAMHILDGYNVNLNWLFITNSTQIGLLCTNALGNSSIQDSVFSYSNYKVLKKYMQGEVECSGDNWGQCRGSNIWIMFSQHVANPTDVPLFFTNFVVARTEISYGVNLKPINGILSNGAGIVINLNPRLGYNVYITITKCNFMNNIDKISAHLHLRIFSNCYILVRDSTFTYGNRMGEGDPMELIPVVYPEFGTILFGVRDDGGNWPAVVATMVLSNVYIAENVGGGLYANLKAKPGNIQLKLKEIKAVCNFLVYAHFLGAHFAFRVDGDITNPRGAHVYLESVEISNNYLEFGDEATRLLWSDHLGSDTFSTLSTNVTG